MKILRVGADFLKKIIPVHSLFKKSSENEGQPAPGPQVLSLEHHHGVILSVSRTHDGYQSATAAMASGGDLALLSPVAIIDGKFMSCTLTGLTATTAMSKQQDEDAPIVEVDITNEDDEEDVVPVCERLKGILAILFATVLIALNNQILFYLFDKLNVKYSKSLFLSWASLIYTVQNFIPMLFIMLRNGKDAIMEPLNNSKKLWTLLVIRGLLGSLVQFSTSHAIDRFMKPAPVSVIAAMAPIFVYINAYFVLKEKLGLIPIVNVFVAIGGVIIMNLSDLMGHQTNLKTLEGTGLALAAMYVLSWITVVIRFLRMLHPVIINLAFGIGVVVVQGTIVLFENSFYWIDEPKVLGLCFCSATATTIGNYFYNVSLRHESAGVVSLLRTTEVLFSFFFQFLFFDIKPGIFTALGGALIIFGVICVTVRKIVGESSENSKLRRYLWFLLY